MSEDTAKNTEFQITFERPLGKLWFYLTSSLVVLASLYTFFEDRLIILHLYSSIILFVVIMVFIYLTFTLLATDNTHVKDWDLTITSTLILSVCYFCITLFLGLPFNFGNKTPIYSF